MSIMRVCIHHAGLSVQLSVAGGAVGFFLPIHQLVGRLVFAENLLETGDLAVNEL